MFGNFLISFSLRASRSLLKIHFFQRNFFSLSLSQCLCLGALLRVGRALKITPNERVVNIDFSSFTRRVACRMTNCKNNNRYILRIQRGQSGAVAREGDGVSSLFRVPENTFVIREWDTIEWRRRRGRRGEIVLRYLSPQINLVRASSYLCAGCARVLRATEKLPLGWNIYIFFWTLLRIYSTSQSSKKRKIDFHNE